jgi:hypothetical protein
MITIHVVVLITFFFSIGVAWFGAGYTVGSVRERWKRRKREQEKVDKNLRVAFNMLEWMENTYLQGQDISEIFQAYLKHLDNL